MPRARPATKRKQRQSRDLRRSSTGEFQPRQSSTSAKTARKASFACLILWQSIQLKVECNGSSNMNEIVANPDNEYSNKYGFYALPKVVQPKFREEGHRVDPTDPVEEIPVPEGEVEGEPYYYVDRKPFPQFIAKESGHDIETQIYDNDRDLFHFDSEVEPILEVLVGQAIEKATNQLTEEWERLEARRLHKEYEEKRALELMVTQRSEARYLRIIQEKERRMLQHETFLKQRKVTHRKLQSKVFAKGLLAGLRNQSLEHLENRGFLHYDISSHIQINYLPWLRKQIVEQLNLAKDLLGDVHGTVDKVERSLVLQHAQAISLENERRQKILQERDRVHQVNENRRRKKKERKRKLLINKRFSEVEQKIFGSIISKAEKADSALKTEVADSLGAVRPRSVFIVPGGLLGQVASFFEMCQLQGDAQVNFLIKLLKASQIEIALKESTNQRLKSLVADQPTKNIAAQKVQFIEMVEREVVESNESAVLLASLGYFQLDTYTAIVKHLIDFVLTTLPRNQAPEVIPPPEANPTGQAVPAPQGGEPQEPAAQIGEQGAEEKEALKIDPLILQKIAVQGKVLVQPVLPAVKVEEVGAFIRVHFPLEHIEEEEKGDKEKPEEDIDSLLDEYIEIFDGEGWARQKGAAAEQPVTLETRGSCYNMSALSEMRALLLAEKNSFQLAVNLGELMEQSPSFQFLLERTRERDRKLEREIKSRIPKETPVFDFQAFQE